MMRAHVGTGAPLEVRTNTRNGSRSLLASVFAASLALMAGCSGVVSQNSKALTTPTSGSGTYSVSGTLSPPAGGSGATVTLSGAASATTTADSSGAYTFTGLANGSYAVTPSRTGYTFSPTTQSAIVNGANVSGVNFSANAQGSQTYSISGTITPTTGGAGTTVTLSGTASATTVANSSGAYSFIGFGNGTYTVTPSHTGYTFSPTSTTATVNGANVTSINFTVNPSGTAHTATASWTASTSVVSGYNVYRGTTSGGPYTKLNGSLIVLLTYADTTVQSGQTYFFVTTAVDGSGNESVFSNEVRAVIP
jgi:hypothetical protein